MGEQLILQDWNENSGPFFLILHKDNYEYYEDYEDYTIEDVKIKLGSDINNYLNYLESLGIL